jgi:hypothetical protein
MYRPFEPRHYVVTDAGNRVARSNDRDLAAALVRDFDHLHSTDGPHHLEVLDLPALP